MERVALAGRTALLISIIQDPMLLPSRGSSIPLITVLVCVLETDFYQVCIPALKKCMKEVGGN